MHETIDHQILSSIIQLTKFNLFLGIFTLIQKY